MVLVLAYRFKLHTLVYPLIQLFIPRIAQCFAHKILGYNMLQLRMHLHGFVQLNVQVQQSSCCLNILLVCA